MGKDWIELHRLRRLLNAIRAVATSAEVNNCPMPGDEVLEKVITPFFSDDVDELIDTLWPGYKFLRIVDCDKPLISKVYPYMQALLNHLQDVKEETSYGQAIYDAAQARFGEYCGDIHKVAYFLDPMFIDEVSTTKEDTATPLMNMTEKVFPIIYPDATPSEMLDIIAKAMGQWGGYRGRSLGLFAKENVWAAAKRMSAVDFWNVYGSHCPELAAFAICILSSHVTSSSCERGWNRYKFIKSKRRGRMHHTRVEKSQFIAINSRLEQPLDEQDDPGFLFAQWTDEDEAFKISRTRPEDGAPAPGEASGRTKFFCWEEQWELEARKDTPVNRFKVQDKFLGMYLFEEDPEEEDDQESDEISEVTQDSKEEGKKSDEKPPPIGECKIVGIYWQKGARGSHKVWRGVVRKVVQDQAGQWVEALKDNGEPIEFEYYLNYSIYPMIQASSLNTHLEVVTTRDEEV